MSNQIENMNMKEENSIDNGWLKAKKNEVIKRLDDGENLQIIMESLPGFKEAFCELDTIDCSDGRVLGGRKIGIAGSGLLLSPEERAKFVENYKGKIKEVTTHRDCGAAALKFNSLSPEEIPAGVMNSDHYGALLGQKLANDLGAEHRFIEMREMANEYHNETALVIDQTGRFNSTHLDNFPPHFVCTGAGLGFSQEYMKSEVKTLAGIALGHHGFGDRFDRQNPFRIIVAAKNQEELNNWIKVGEEATADFGGRVQIKGFITPEKSADK